MRSRLSNSAFTIAGRCHGAPLYTAVLTDRLGYLQAERTDLRVACLGLSMLKDQESYRMLNQSRASLSFSTHTWTGVADL